MIEDPDLEHMRLAISEAKRSRSEEDDRPHPKVGAVVVRDNQVLASACRGDHTLGEHAEYRALEGMLANETLAGCTVYTTLEPCTARHYPKVPCAERLVDRRIGRVVIGALDPDQRITGQGVLCLRQAGIAVDLFPPNLMAEVEELNRDFIRDRRKKAASTLPDGVKEAGLTAFYPSRDFYSSFRPDAASIARYVSNAAHSVIMVSINLRTGLEFHDLCECLQTSLGSPSERFSATISLLDPYQTELMSVMAPVLNRNSNELASDIQRSLRELCQFRQALSPDVRPRLDIRVHKVLPFGSAILLDHNHPNGRIQIETKPYKAGIQKSFAFEVRRTESSDLYDVLAKSYDKVLDDGTSVQDENQVMKNGGQRLSMEE